MFDRILIANRGEIALRIIRAARVLGIETICVFSEADAEGPWLEHADATICIGPASSAESYLRVDRVISAAETTQAEAIHPGYGFLAENAQFAEVCRDCHIEFIGPSPEAMARLGDKISCRTLAKKVGLPIARGSDGAIEGIDEGLVLAAKIGYPVIIKATAGGGGRGMRVAHDEKSLRDGMTSARQEAAAAFGDGAVYIEQFIETARHVEVQVLGDRYGGAIHLLDRDCTTQRRHQKLVEEGPAPRIDEETRRTICEAAAMLIRDAEYAGAATVEFLLGDDGTFHMMEVNTRIQVEHPVTEMITGIDIVAQGIRIAAGERLAIDQEDVQPNGHAIECRINAEDPDRGFMPQPGLIESFVPPGGMGVRVDTHVRAGYRIPPDYDSMIGKLIVHGRDRDEAIARMRIALDEFTIGPVKTTIPFHRALMDHEDFLSSSHDIHSVDRMLEAALPEA